MDISKKCGASPERHSGPGCAEGGGSARASWGGGGYQVGGRGWRAEGGAIYIYIYIYTYCVHMYLHIMYIHMQDIVQVHVPHIPASKELGFLVKWLVS